MSLLDPSVQAARKYVSQLRDPTDALSPGPKFGYWNDYNPADGVQAHYRNDVRLDCVLRQPDEACVGSGSTVVVAKRPAASTDTISGCDKCELLSKVLQRANEERRERERATAALTDAQATVARERDLARRAAIDRVTAERKVKGLQQRGDDALAQLDELSKEHEHALAVLHEEHASALAALRQAKDEEVSEAMRARDESARTVADLRAELARVQSTLEETEQQAAASSAALRVERDKALAASRAANSQWKACAAELTAVSKVSQTLNQELISEKVGGPVCATVSCP